MTLVFHQTENVDKEKEFNQKNDVQTLKLKSTITEMKIYQKSSTGLRISEFEVASIEIQFKKHKEKKNKENKQSLLSDFQGQKEKTIQMYTS